MPHRVQWDDARDLLTCQLFGAVEGDDVLALVDEACEHPNPAGSLNICCDCRAIRRLVVAPSDITSIVTRLHKFASEHPYGRTAIVTERLIDRGMAKLLILKTHGDTRDRKQFDDMDEAVAWLTQSSPASA